MTTIKAMNNYKRRKAIVEDLMRDGTCMVAVMDLQHVCEKLIEKCCNFKIDYVNNGIYMVNVTRLNVYKYA